MCCLLALILNVVISCPSSSSTRHLACHLISPGGNASLVTRHGSLSFERENVIRQCRGIGWQAREGTHLEMHTKHRPLFTPYDIRTSSQNVNLAPKSWCQSMTPPQTLHEIYKRKSFNCTVILRILGLHIAP